MDEHLRAYLERPVPRPPLRDSRFDRRREVWLAPLGAAVAGGVVAGSIVAEQEDKWIVGLFVWAGVVVAGACLGQAVGRLTQSLYRRGIFATAQVLGAEVVADGEDRGLSVTFSVELFGGLQSYRDAGTERSRYVARLTDRWLGGEDHLPFRPGAQFPILISPKREAAIVFVELETIEAARAPEARGPR